MTVTCHDLYYSSHTHTPSVSGISGIYTAPTSVSAVGAMSTFKPMDALIKISIPEPTATVVGSQQSPLTPVRHAPPPPEAVAGDANVSGSLF